MPTDPELQILTTDDAERWDAAVRAFPDWDVYWLSGYAASWETAGDGVAFLGLMQEADQAMAQVWLRRELRDHPTVRCDLVTPYGYGGPLATPGAGDLQDRFRTAVSEYAGVIGAVSEFVRYHPLLGNQHGQPHVRQNGQTVCLDLAGDVWADLKPEVQNRIRKARRSGVQVRLTPEPDVLDRFTELYRLTMARRNASAWYFFSDDYFLALQKRLAGHLLLGESVLDGKVVSAALFFHGNRFLHYHLGGSDPTWLKLSPNHLLFYEAACWGREHGLREMHLGGGMRPGDGMAQFKAGFSPHRREFCTGALVFDHAAYDELVSRRKAEVGHRPLADGYFPAYRAPVAPSGQAEEEPRS